MVKAYILVAGVAVLNIFGLTVAAQSSTEHCAGMVFRETPYANLRCARPLSGSQIANIKHFELDYDGHGRLSEMRYVQAGKLRAYSDRFVRAPRITIHYASDQDDGNQEIRHFYNEWGTRTLVSGDVYEARFQLDDRNRRESLVFYGLDGEPVNNDFGIARYAWTTLDDGEVIEHRYNTEGKLVRNRPGFGYMVTRFAYDANGLLTRMYNLGSAGQQLTPDEAGIAMTQIGYDLHGQFIQWLNLDMNNRPKRGMSDLAEIVYQPSRFNGEQIAIFNDADGSPQATRWGAHKVVYEFDKYGNPVNRLHFDTNGQPVNSSSGIGQIRSTWTADGAYQLSETYFDKDGNPIASKSSGVHAIITKIGANSRPQSITFNGMNGNPSVHKGRGYAIEAYEYDDAGRLIVRKFMNADRTAANHGTWDVARFEYRYLEDGSLDSVDSFAADGTARKPIWNPAH